MLLIMRFYPITTMVRIVIMRKMITTRISIPMTMKTIVPM